MDAPAPNGEAATKPPEKPTTANAPAAGTPSTDGAQPAKLSNAELKAKKQAEKAARRGKVVAAKEVAVALSPAAAQASGSASQPGKSDQASKSGKPREDGLASVAARPGQQRRPSAGNRGQAHAAQQKAAEPAKKEPVVTMFSHLALPRNASLLDAPKDVHPSVLALGQKMASFALSDNAARCKAMLLAFKKVMSEYESPPNSSFSRHFVPHALSSQIEYLSHCRPICFAMGNAIRKVKHWVSLFDIHIEDKVAKEDLIDRIDLFIQEKIDLADGVVTKNASEMIKDGDLVLTFGGTRLVRQALQRAWAEQGRQFQVAIVDDGPHGWATGRTLAKDLRKTCPGMRVFYYPSLSGLGIHVKSAAKVLLGAEGFFENGSMYAPLGTLDVAVAAADRGVPVLALCETVHFAKDKVAVDSLTYNERVKFELDDEEEVVEQCLFDVTPEKYLTMVVTEYESISGNCPPSAIGSILRKQEGPDEAV